MNIKQHVAIIAGWSFALFCVVLVNMIHNHTEALGDMGIFQPVGDIVQSLIDETGKWTTTFIIVLIVAVVFIAGHLFFESERGKK